MLRYGKINTIMLSTKLLLLFVTSACLGTNIFEDVGQANLEAVRIRLEEEKAKRLLLQNDVEVLMIQVEELKRKCGQKDNTASGTTYVRWGRTDCSGNGTELVYKGYMAGSEYTQTGSGTNHLCLPEYPTWAKYKDGNSGPDYRGHVYGAEYEIGLHDEYIPFSSPVLDNNAPCAICRTIRSTSIMIPGRTNCYPGWTAEYSGYLVSSYYSQAAPSEYVCLDGDPEFIAGGGGNQNGHVLYLVDVICGTLLCPPYVNGRELACVVCSK
ncbi:hypothetical protein CHS0354_037149 [Potamilus streckersoni]|uniref:Short-chain collagen C4-like n=1 Tax=Potamilus streckersoni TaxID=2493646 RepID=A0AAE0RPH1_9BIVA|nr:hypothetical protein CHS0354_037149 [Potamilus streckersoni]